MNSPSSLEPWQIDDAKRLKAIFLGKANCNQAAFGATYDIGNQSMVSQYLNAKRPLNIEAAKKFAIGLSVTIGEFSPTIAKMIEEANELLDSVVDDEFVKVRKLDVRLAAGHGAEVFEGEEETTIAFRRDFIYKSGVNAYAAVAVYVAGESMLPTIPDGAIVLIDRSNTIIYNGKIYGLRYDGRLYIKRLLRENGKLLARSDNQVGNPDLDLEKRKVDFEVLGRAFWCGFTL